MAKRNNIEKPAVPPKAVQSAPAVRVEFPKEGETLAHPTYTFRIGALPEAKNVEISIDNGEWRACRESLGLWWYDWSDYTKGGHTLSARARFGTDMTAVSAPRRFTVSNT